MNVKRFKCLTIIDEKYVLNSHFAVKYNYKKAADAVADLNYGAGSHFQNERVKNGTYTKI